MGLMTPEAKKALHEMLYYAVAAEMRRNGRGAKALLCYQIAARRANYCLEALGESLDEN